MRHRCLCRCHQLADERNRADGVDLRDPVNAVSACADCQGKHAVALSDTPDTPDEPTPDASLTPTTYLPPQPWNGMDVTDGADGEEGG